MYNKSRQRGKLVRVGLRVPEWVREWYENKSSETGISMSALMSMDLMDKIQQSDLIRQFPEFNNLTQELLNLQNNPDLIRSIVKGVESKGK